MFHAASPADDDDGDERTWDDGYDDGYDGQGDDHDEAYVAHAEDAPGNEEDGFESSDGETPYAYFAGDTEEYEDEKQAIEQDVVCSFLAAGADPNDSDDCGQMAEAAQAETYAYFTRKQFKGKGVSTSARVHNYKPPRNEIKWDTRKKRVEDAKKKSRCRDCGEIGHWSGDPQCKKKKSVAFNIRPKSKAKPTKQFRKFGGKPPGRSPGYLIIGDQSSSSDESWTGTRRVRSHGDARQPR